MREVITEIAVSAAMVVLPIVCAYVGYFIQLKTQQIKKQMEGIQEENKKKLFCNAISSVEDLALRTVTAIEQTTGKALREEVKNGTKTEEELQALAVKAFHTVVSQLKPEYRKVIETNVNDFSKYLTNLIECKVYEVKNTNYIK